ncbi:MAG TPA: hypothetical protein VHC67_09215 [Gaiellaceae bacterium]|nr:hypothetical protein [Gaiellaceae bacterium]
MHKRPVLLVSLAALCAAGTALAATLDREQHKFNAADQSAARSAVLVKADLGTTGWTGGATKPDLGPPQTCANYDPKQSDLVLTGIAETHWKHPGLEVDTEAQVLQTPAMVKLDWQRTVIDPDAGACLKENIIKSLKSSRTIKFVSFQRVVFPHVGAYSRAYVTTIQVTANGSTVPLAVEDVLIGNKRTEFTIESTTAKAEQAAVHTALARLAKILVARAKA